MKTIQKSLIIAILVVVLLGTAVLALPAGTVSAQTPIPPTPADQAARGITRLEKAYQFELKALEKQEKALKGAEQMVEKAKEAIAKIKEKGGDPVKLEAALKAYEAKLAEAKKLHETAAAILKTHTGFDANGKVTDRAKAVETVKSAGQAIRQAHKAMGEGRKEILNLLKEWRKNWIKNRPTKPNA